MRDDWDKKTLPVAVSQDLSNYNLESTYAFQISNPSTSTAKMARRVNLLPYKNGDSIKWKKRPGCKSTTALTSSGTSLIKVSSAAMSSANVFYIVGNPNSGRGGQSVMCSTNGSTWTEHAPAYYDFAGAGTLPGYFYPLPASGAYPQHLSETNIANTTYMFMMVQSSGSYTSRLVSDTTNAYYIKESDVTALTNGPVQGSCSVTNGSAVITGIADTAKFAVNQMITIGIENYYQTAYIVSVDTTTQITINANISLNAHTGTAYYTKGSVYIISDTDFPMGSANLSITGNFVSLNGYLYIMCVNGRIYNSDINSASSWTSTGFITAQMFPDKGVTLAGYKNMILAFGERSIEFFRDVGNAAGSPLQSVPELAIKLGIRYPTHLVQVEDTLCFISNTGEGANSIYIMDGFQPRKISTDDIDYVISKMLPSNFELKTLRLNGKLCLLVNRINTDTSTVFTTFVYYVEEDEWAEWKVTEGGTAADYTHPWQFPMGSLSGTFYSVSDYQTTNGVYVSTFLAESDNNYYDNLAASSKNVTTYVQTPILTMGTLNRKFLSQLRLYDSTSSLLNPGAAVTVYWSDDFGVTWTSRTFASTKQFLDNLGSFKERIFRIVEASNDFYQISEMELIYKLGNH